MLLWFQAANFDWSLDEVEHASTEKILEIFAELASLFEARQDVPNGTNLSTLKPDLTFYKFLEHILDKMRIEGSWSGVTETYSEKYYWSEHPRKRNRSQSSLDR